MMDNPEKEQQAGQEFSIGDKVTIPDKKVNGEVVGVREFNGRKTYVVDTDKGNRLVLGARQIEKIVA